MTDRASRNHDMEIVTPTIPYHPELLKMDSPHTTPNEWPKTRPSTYRQRSNSFPIVEALGCSTPEALLILAEGRAAVRKRRRGRIHRSVDDEEATTYEPRNHLKYLEGRQDWPTTEPVFSDARSCHARIPSNATDRSTSTIVPVSADGGSREIYSTTSPLGNYSANLAQFVKAQLNSIPTYHLDPDSVSALSPKSCPDFSFPMRTPSLSPTLSVRKPAQAPKAIEIPPVRPPGRSAFSAWSSTDDEGDDDAAFLPDVEQYVKAAESKRSSYTPSVFGYYEASNSASSFFFSSTPIEEHDDPDTAKASTFPDQDALPGSANESHDDDSSSDLSRPQLSSSSAPSFSSSSASASASSYFDCKRPRPFTIAPQLKDRIIAALTPPHPYSTMISATSPWEGGSIANVHDLYIESQQRVHIDGMSFDMVRDFIAPRQATTPC